MVLGSLVVQRQHDEREQQRAAIMAGVAFGRINTEERELAQNRRILQEQRRSKEEEQAMFDDLFEDDEITDPTES